ncbi:MAG: energy transducer TonB [Salinisphaeraceae bacterium]|nr:energy transducer TonB [Salinisphaeraceae bacterium]
MTANADFFPWQSASSGARGLRVFVAAVVAVFIAAGLFLLMMYMVHNTDAGIDDDADLGAVNFIRFNEKDDQLKTKDRSKPEEPPPPKEPPPPAPEVSANIPAPQANLPKLDIPNIKTNVNVNAAPYLGNVENAAPAPAKSTGEADRDVAAVVRVPPVYPSTAKRAKIEGYVTLEFTVAPDGSVSDISVLDAQPPRMFNQAAIAAIQRWRFKPRVQGGQRVAAKARQTIRFELDN